DRVGDAGRGVAQGHRPGRIQDDVFGRGNRPHHRALRGHAQLLDDADGLVPRDAHVELHEVLQGDDRAFRRESAEADVTNGSEKWLKTHRVTMASKSSNRIPDCAWKALSKGTPLCRALNKL